MEAKRVFKSKKKLSGSRCTYRAWKNWAVGDYLIGKYVGSKTDNYDKPNWMVEVVEASFSKKKESKELIGQIIGLNSAGQFDKAMEKVAEGELVQVMYNGMGEIEKGKYAGKDAHSIEVDLVTEDGDDDSDSDEYEDEDEEGL